MKKAKPISKDADLKKDNNVTLLDRLIEATKSLPPGYAIIFHPKTETVTIEYNGVLAKTHVLAEEWLQQNELIQRAS